MGKDSFDITALLGNQVSKLGTNEGGDQLVQISPKDINPNRDNFFDTDDVDDLAESIDLLGLQQPLVVTDSGAGWLLLAGHRRLKAILKLCAKDPERWATVPCMVAQTSSEAMSKLILVQTNTQARGALSPVELVRAAQEVEAALVELQEQEGVKLPGRMRDKVAQALQVSAAKLSRAKVISEKLLPELQALELSEQAAYAVARMPEDVQQLLWRPCQTEPIKGSVAETLLEKLPAIMDDTCPHGCKECQNKIHMIVQSAAAPGEWSVCDGCCEKCYRNCTYRCQPSQDARTKAEAERKAVQKARSEQVKAENEAALAAFRATPGAQLGVRIRRLAANQAVSDAELFHALNPDWEVDKFSSDEIREEVDGALDIDSPGGLMDFDAIMLSDVADLLHCSVDYLLGRAETPTPYAPVWTKVEDGLPEEGQFCYVLYESGEEVRSVFFNRAFMDSTNKSTANNQLFGVTWWIPAPPFPDGMFRPGSYTLNSQIKERSRYGHLQ